MLIWRAFWTARRSAGFECGSGPPRSEEHTSELQSQSKLVCRLLLEKQKHAMASGSDLPERHTPCEALTIRRPPSYRPLTQSHTSPSHEPTSPPLPRLPRADREHLSH